MIAACVLFELQKITSKITSVPVPVMVAPCMYLSAPTPQLYLVLLLLQHKSGLQTPYVQTPYVQPVT